MSVSTARGSQNGPPPSSANLPTLTFIRNWGTSMLAAGVAIIPSLSDLSVSKIQQRGMTLPLKESLWPQLKNIAHDKKLTSLSVKALASQMLIQQKMSERMKATWAGLKAGSKAAPFVGGLVGSQMTLQNLVREKVESIFGSNYPIPTLFGSSVIVGVVSAPGEAAFNAVCSKQSPLHAAKKVFKAPKIFGASAFQETGTVAGFAGGKLLATPMKEVLGDAKSVEHAANFISGALGAAAGHAGNTIMVRLQNDLEVESLRQLKLGIGPRARALGVFSVIYNASTDHLKSVCEKLGF